MIVPPTSKAVAGDALFIPTFSSLISTNNVSVSITKSFANVVTPVTPNVPLTSPFPFKSNPVPVIVPPTSKAVAGVS